MINISLVVPTYNRADYLYKSLETFVNQSLNKNYYEIIVVDNNSTDDTKKVFDSFVGRFPEHNWVYFFEPRQGLHYARNRGILLAKGEIIVFGDDDIEASPKWLEAILQSFYKDEKIGVVGGPIAPIWDEKPPEWIYDYGTKDLHGVFAYLNYGNESKYLENNEYVFGCNFAIRKKIAIGINGSGPDTFPGSMIHYAGPGESAMVLRVKDKGYRIYYNADAVVGHHCPVSRCTIDYFVNRCRRWAVEGIYHQYNTDISLTGIFISLKNQSVDFIKLFLDRKTLNSKINKKYFLVIQRKYIIFAWKHFFKLIADPKLREYTKISSYLEELTAK